MSRSARKNGASGCDVQLAERVGKDARHDRAVLERVAEPGRRLRARADDPPLAVGAAREIERDEVQEDAAGGPRRRGRRAGSRDAGTRAPAESAPRAAASARRRDRRRRRSSSRARCRRPRSSCSHSAAGDEQRQDVERPRPAGAVGRRVDVVGDAVLVNLPRDALPARAPGSRRSSSPAWPTKRLPVRAQRAGAGRAVRRSARAGTGVARAASAREAGSRRRPSVRSQRRVAACVSGLRFAGPACTETRGCATGGAAMHRSRACGPAAKNRASRRLSAS